MSTTSQTDAPRSAPTVSNSRDPVADRLWKDAANHCDTLPGLMTEFGEYVQWVDAKKGRYKVGGFDFQIDAEKHAFEITNPPEQGFASLRNKASGTGVLGLACTVFEILRKPADNKRCFSDACLFLRKRYPQLAAYKPSAEEIAAKRAELEAKENADKLLKAQIVAAWKQGVSSLDTPRLLSDLGYSDCRKDTANQWHYKVDGHTVNVRMDGTPGFPFGVLPGSDKTTFASLNGKAGGRGNLALTKLVMEIQGRGSNEESCYEAARAWLDQTYPQLGGTRGAQTPITLKPNTYVPPPKAKDEPVEAEKVPRRHTRGPLHEQCQRYLEGRGISPATIQACYEQGFYFSGENPFGHGPVLCTPLKGWETGTMVGVAIKPAGGQKGPQGQTKGIIQGKAARGGMVLGDPETATTVWMTEAAVDVASLYELNHQQNPKAAYVAMAGARIPGPDFIDAFFANFPNAKEFVGAFNNDYVGRRASQDLANEATKRGHSGRVQVPANGELVIDIAMNGLCGLGEQQLHSLLRSCQDANIPHAFSTTASPERAKRLTQFYTALETPQASPDLTTWQTVRVANTPDACSVVHRLNAQAQEARDALTKEQRSTSPKEFAVLAINKDWNDVLKGVRSASTIPQPGAALPPAHRGEDDQVARLLQERHCLKPAMATHLVEKRHAYASREPVTMEWRVVEPLLDFDTLKPIGFVSEDVATGEVSVCGARNCGASMLGQFGPDTKRVVLTSSMESAAAKWETSPDEQTCVMGFAGDQCPERLLQLCKEKGLDLSVALDSTPQARALGDQIEARAKEMGISPERLMREEPASTILLSYADTEKGRAEAEREKALLREHHRNVREYPVEDGIVRISTENTRDSESVLKRLREKGTNPADSKAAVREASQCETSTIEFFGTSWANQSYSRTFQRGFERTGTVIEPDAPKAAEKAAAVRPAVPPKPVKPPVADLNNEEPDLDR